MIEHSVQFILHLSWSKLLSFHFVNVKFYRYRPRRRGTFIGRALIKAKRSLFRRRVLRGRKRTLLVITDGASSDDVSGPASSLKKNGVELFALGIGSRYSRSQLIKIASSPLNVFTAGFSRLGTVVRAVKAKVCRPTPTRKFFLGFWLFGCELHVLNDTSVGLC